MKDHTKADCSLQGQPAFCFCTIPDTKPAAAYPAKGRNDIAFAGWITALHNPLLRKKTPGDAHGM